MLESKPGFRSRKVAENYGRDQEAAIRNNTYLDPRAGRITLIEWVNRWFPAQDLELNTLSTYKYTIEVLILPTFGNRPLMSLETHEIATWERELIARGYQRRTAREARSTLATILSDAMPRYIQTNPAARKRGKGRKGQRRIERAEKAERSWASPLEVLLFAERCAALSGHDEDFVLAVTVAYTGMRWSEAMGLSPECVHREVVKINWKLYELDSRFYRGRPKDGSIRDADLPPFLAELLARHLDCNGAEVHVPEYRPSLVPGRGVRVPRSAERALPPVQLWYPDRAARCGRLVSETGRTIQSAYRARPRGHKRAMARSTVVALGASRPR
jgi:integrase